MKLGKKLFFGICILSICLDSSIVSAFSTFYLHTDTTVQFEAILDAAGYSDWMIWGLSPYHPHPSHELLSGEWGAAIYYNGISTAPNAMWLTDSFVCPNWSTYTDFTTSSYSSWNNPNNPIVGLDTAQSVISNSQVQVTIDYEMVDLGQHGFSHLVYREPGGAVRIARSERYVLLQTYTIKNIKAQGSITGLEFYQLLHGHGADDYGQVVHCSYQTLDFPDALENYTPYNPVHRVGNFKYDITQWNNPDDPAANPHSEPHQDWVGFSSTVAPNVFDCNVYEGHVYEPTRGTHKHIESRTLNNKTYTYGETAGALGWYLPTLAPGQSTSITVAFMFGTLNWPIPTILTKVNADPNNECVYPWNSVENNYLTYNIHYDANGYPIDDVWLIDYLPAELEYSSSEPNGTYSSEDHSVRWYLGNLAANATGNVQLVCKVNNYAKPCSTITNHAVLDSEHIYYTQTDCNVSICPYGSNVIYVDWDATGYNNGTSWTNAYNDLQDALTQARNCPGAVTAIWVAAGTYKPVKDINVPDYQNKSFELPENVALIGHFSGTETDPSQRNLSNPNNETILEGQIGAEFHQAVQNVVRAQDVTNGLVDGFTIRGSYYGAGIKLENSHIGIVNCKLKKNSNYGIDMQNFSYPDVHNCTFSDNPHYGIYIYNHCWPQIANCIFDGNDTTSCGIQHGNYSVPTVDNCQFKNHTFYAIEGSNGTLNVTNCNIVNNPYGLSVSNCDLTVVHSVIANNGSEGIRAQNGCNLTMDRSVVRYNGEHGIELNDNLLTTIKNSWIYNNGTKQVAYYGGAGICFNNQSSFPLVRNNTIYDNFTYGIESSHYGADPNIVNCIIYGNDSNDLYWENGTFNKVNYCLLQHPHSGIGNKTGDPGFMNVTIDPNDLHIDEDSPCKDAGNPYANYSGETDIDGEGRGKYGRVDIGGDEYYISLADFTGDDIVNFIDYAEFARVWLSPNSGKSLDGDTDVDIYDLKLFCEDWLWQAPWDDGWMMSMGGADGGDLGKSLAVESFEAAEEIKTKGADSLMITDAATSLAKRPQRLAAKSDIFYSIKPRQLPPDLPYRLSRKTDVEKTLTEKTEIEEILRWLDEIWLDPEVRKVIDEATWLKFRESLMEEIRN